MAYGRSGYQELVTRSCLCAQRLGQSIEQSPRFELLAPVILNIVCFAFRGADARQRDHLLEELKRDGQVLLTPTFYAGKPAIRAAFVNWATTEKDVERIVETLERCAAQVALHSQNRRKELP